MGVVGAALRGFGKALKRKGKVYKAIKSVKPYSGKVPSYIGGSPKQRVEQVKTHFHVKRIDKVEKAKKQIKEGKQTLKDMEATGQAKEFTDYKGKGTGDYHAK